MGLWQTLKDALAPPDRVEPPLTQKLLDAHHVLDELFWDDRLRPGDFKGELSRMQSRIMDEYETQIGFPPRER